MKPVPGILDIAPYVGGRAEAKGAGPVYKLSSNESPLAPSLAAIEAFKAASTSIHLYPDGSSSALRHAIGDTFGLNPERIICGNGSGEILSLLPQIYTSPGDEVLFSAHGFLLYRIAALAASAVPVAVSEPKLTTDIDGLLRHASEKTKIVFVSNPNNPTGSYNSAADLRRLRAGLPENCLLVIDAAYAEYVDRNDYESGIELVATSTNTLMTRTFSKIYGLASLRVGWAYGPASVVDAYNRVRGPFNISTPAQAAAVAAIKDLGHLARAKAHNTKWLDWLSTQIQAIGLKVHPSVGNFLMIEFSSSGAKTAAAADKFLYDRGVIVRAITAYGLPNCLRITVGTEEGNRAAIAALKEFMA